MQYKKITLPNGLRIIHVPVKGNPSVTVMALVETGSNYESKEENGLSHFLEHMMFKGTKKRPTSMDINKELDGLGAQSNAFTGNEVTGYWAKAEKKHFKKLLEIISDLYINPTLPAKELEKERGVILQEISMYEDQPQMKVWEVFSELMYGDTPAGRSIAGTPNNIKKFKREDFEEYRNRHYTAKKTIVVVAGDIKESLVLDDAKKYFKGIKDAKKVGKDKVSSEQSSPKMKIFKKKTDQTHLVLGFKLKTKSDKERLSLKLLAGVLGKGMSSRLFQKMREELGICYYVSAGRGEFTDHGYFTVSTGVDPKRVDEALKAIIEECHKLKTDLVTVEELNKTKDYLIGSMYLSLETTDALADYYVEQEIVRGEMRDPKSLESSIRSITPKDLITISKKVFVKEKMNLAVVGEGMDLPRLKKLLVL